MRWAAFEDPKLLTNPRMNPPSMVFGVTFYLMGLTNVLLAIWTRPAVLLIGSDGQLDPNDPRVGEAVVNDFDLPQISLSRTNRE